jgi:hypothetical protein
MATVPIGSRFNSETLAIMRARTRTAIRNSRNLLEYAF